MEKAKKTHKQRVEVMVTVIYLPVCGHIKEAARDILPVHKP